MREPADSDRAVIDAARSALFEIADPETVGPATAVLEREDGVIDVHFASTLPGYPGWRWTVSVSVLDGFDAPSVLETELTPGEGALLAPDWVPWADRLAEYRAAGHETPELVDEDLDDDDLDDDDDDDDDIDDDDDDLDDDGFHDGDGDAEVEDVLNPDDDLDGVDFEDAASAEDAEAIDAGHDHRADDVSPRG